MNIPKWHFTWLAICYLPLFVSIDDLVGFTEDWDLIWCLACMNGMEWAFHSSILLFIWLHLSKLWFDFIMNFVIQLDEMDNSPEKFKNVHYTTSLNSIWSSSFGNLFSIPSSFQDKMKHHVSLNAYTFYSFKFLSLFYPFPQNKQDLQPSSWVRSSGLLRVLWYLIYWQLANSL